MRTNMEICTTPVVVDRGFPYLAVAILSLCFIINAYTLVNIFPYVGLMATDLLNLESTNESGFYAGYVASAFTFGRFVTAYPVGLVSDKVGRKPVILAGLAATVVFSLSFGLAPSFEWAVASRLLLGMTNGIVAASRASVREICGRRHVVMGMAYVGGLRGVALVLGTGIGGLLAQPALHYPGTFSSTGLLARYPYLLPNLVGAILALAAMPLVIFALPETKDFHETHPEIEAAELEGTAVETDSANASSGGAQPKDAGVVTPSHSCVRKDGICGRDGLLSSPVVRVVLFLAAIYQLIWMGFDEAFPLWTLSTHDVGGLEWGSKDIGKVFLGAGFILAAGQLVGFPLIIRRIGLSSWQRVGCAFGLVGFLAAPNSAYLSWNEGSLVAACIIGVLFVNVAFAAIGIGLMVASTNIAPPHQRGTLSGLYNTAESFGRFTGPAGFATMYAYSVSPQAEDVPIIDYHFVFYLSFVVMIVITILCWTVITPAVLEKNKADDEGRQQILSDETDTAESQ